MMPSPGERYYMDQEQQRLHEMDAADAIGASYRALLAATAGASYSTSVGTLGGERTAMQHSEQSVDLGDGELGGDGWTLVPLPGNYGTAVSVIVQITVAAVALVGAERVLGGRNHPQPPVLQWAVATYVQPDAPMQLKPPGGAGSQFLKPGAHGFTRLYGPFASHIGIQLAGIGVWAMDANGWSPEQAQRAARYQGLHVSVVAQTA